MSRRMVDRLIGYYSNADRVKAVELGDFTGEGAFRLLEACPTLTLHWICPWEHMIERAVTSNVSMNKDELTHRYEEGKKTLERFIGRSQIVKGFYDEASYSFKDDSLDFVFFNTAHSSEEEMKRDLLLWIPKIVDEGLISGAYWPMGRFKGLMDFFSSKLEFCSFDDGSWGLSPVNEDVREWAIVSSKREGDWNESGYFEANNPDRRGR